MLRCLARQAPEVDSGACGSLLLMFRFCLPFGDIYQQALFYAFDPGLQRFERGSGWLVKHSFPIDDVLWREEFVGWLADLLGDTIHRRLYALVLKFNCQSA